MDPNQMLEMAWKDKNTKFLCEFYFGDEISDLQAVVIRMITFWKQLGYRKIGICAMTRWGKTFCVSRGIGLYIISRMDRKTMFVAPITEQAAILRDYMGDLVLKCPALFEIADLEVKGAKKLKKEASKKRLTFSNGCEYRIFSAHGTAAGLMGFGVGSGGGIVVKDEACGIDRSANAKISRMIGDNPEDTLEIELFNPWDRDNKAFEHWCDPTWHHIHVGWEDAIKDGRTTQAFVDEQRKELTPLEFTVLYDSKFPKESKDSIFNLGKIERARKQDFGFDKELDELEKKLKDPHKMTESELKELEDELKKFTRVISCDPADQGLDSTVIYNGIKKELRYQQIGEFHEPKSDPMEIVGRIISILMKTYNGQTRNIIQIDRIGIGTGPLSRLKEIIREKGLKNVKVIGCHFGEKAINDDHYKNKKAENYFRLQALFNEGMIQIIDRRELTNQLVSMKWKLTSSGKRIVVDPDKSPDWADSLVYFVWRDDREMAFAFA